MSGKAPKQNYRESYFINPGKQHKMGAQPVPKNISHTQSQVVLAGATAYNSTVSNKKIDHTRSSINPIRGDIGSVQSSSPVKMRTDQR